MRSSLTSTQVQSDPLVDCSWWFVEDIPEGLLQRHTETYTMSQTYRLNRPGGPIKWKRATSCFCHTQQFHTQSHVRWHWQSHVFSRQTVTYDSHIWKYTWHSHFFLTPNSHTWQSFLSNMSVIFNNCRHCQVSVHTRINKYVYHMSVTGVVTRDSHTRQSNQAVTLNSHNIESHHTVT